MNREKIVNAILKKFHASENQEESCRIIETLRRITSDLNLLTFAIELGIDTDAVLAEV